MREIRELKAHLSNLKQSLEFTEDRLEETVNGLKSENEKLKSKMKELYECPKDPEFIKNKLVKLVDHSRRCSLRLDGVKETSNETWEKYDKHSETLSKYKLGIEENIILERVRRIESSSEGRRSRRRTIFCKFHNYEDKVKVLSNAKKIKGTNISIKTAFGQKNLAYTKKLWKEVKQLQSEGKITYLNYRSIICQDTNDSYNEHDFLSSLCR